MGQQSPDRPTTTGGTLPGQAGIASVHAVGFAGLHAAASGSQRNAGHQSSRAVPSQRWVPGGHAGAGVAGHGAVLAHTGWQVTWAQQSLE